MYKLSERQNFYVYLPQTCTNYKTNCEIVLLIFMNKIIIVGCGLCGGVIARECAEAGFNVRIFERRNHIAGNLFDYVDDHGILVQKYGPHTFHTTKKIIYDYIRKFSDWTEYKLKCGAVINGICTPVPFNFQTIDQFYSVNDAKLLKNHISKFFTEKKSVPVVDLITHQDKIIREYGQFLFDNDYSLYSSKQWGIPVENIDTSILRRVPIRLDYKNGYFDDDYQFMPKHSFTSFFKNLINHPRIEVVMNTDATQLIQITEDKIYFDGRIINSPLVFTGPIDQLFRYENGFLPYRSLRFKFVYENIESFQKFPVVAYPQIPDFTRITEFKKLTNQKSVGTTYAIEYPLDCQPGSNNEPYYPVLTHYSNAILNSYKRVSSRIKNLYLCGRLANFKYYNMDQAIEVALNTSKAIIDKI